MIKKITRIFVVVVLLFSLTLTSAFAGTDASLPATKTIIPGTNVKADSRVVDAFVELGFTVKYDKNLNYAGVFSVGKHAIIMKYDKQLYILHEMGHFVSIINNSADESKEFKAIYKAEAKLYNGIKKTYVKSSSQEYFAQSFAEYTKTPSALKKSRPKTYYYIKEQIESIDQQAIDAMYAAYSWAW